MRETASLVAERKLTARQRVDASLDRIAADDATIGAFLQVWSDEARACADAVDADESLRTGRLAGVPVALKDNLCVAGHAATAGSRLLEGFVAPYTATAAQRLIEAGAVIVGKTNLDEFAMGSSTENSALGVTRNPHDLERVPGGSSGGSASAVAAGMVPLALGSDTGGSIRQPAAFCGVAGLKPTYGRVSRYGLIAFASSLDQIGPVAGSVDDAAVALEVIAGADPCDSTALEIDVPRYSQAEPIDPARLRIGVPDDWLGQGLDAEIRAAIEAALEGLEKAGAELQHIQLPHQKYAVATYYVIAMAEASSNLARYDGVRYGRRAAAVVDLEDLLSRSRSEGFGEEVQRRVLLGTYVLSAGYYDAYYGRAQRVRTLLRRDFDAAFDRVDVVIGPTTPTTAFRRGDKTDDPVSMYLSDVYTVTANLAGLPALSQPCGKDTDGLPISAQIVGPALREDLVLGVGRLLEQTLA